MRDDIISGRAADGCLIQRNPNTSTRRRFPRAFTSRSRVTMTTAEAEARARESVGIDNGEKYL